MEIEDEELKAMLNSDADKYYAEKMELIASNRMFDDLRTAKWVNNDPQFRAIVWGELGQLGAIPPRLKPRPLR